MPSMPPKPCSKAGCFGYAVEGGRCSKHKHSHNWGNSSGSSRGYGWEWSRLKKKILERDGHLCKVCLKCGIYTNASDVDHIINKKNGGTDACDNLQSICKYHHDLKTQGESKNGRHS